MKLGRSDGKFCCSSWSSGGGLGDPSVSVGAVGGSWPIHEDGPGAVGIENSGSMTSNLSDQVEGSDQVEDMEVDGARRLVSVQIC